MPGQCQLTINVVSSTPNTYLNTIAAGAVASSQGTNPQDAQATLVVSAPANITGTKAFVPNNVHGNGAASTLTITLTNPNPVPLTNAALTDTLPGDAQHRRHAERVDDLRRRDGDTSTREQSGDHCPDRRDDSRQRVVHDQGRRDRTQSERRHQRRFDQHDRAGALTTTEGATSPAISGAITVQTGARSRRSFAPNPIPAGGATPSTMTITINNFNNSTLTPITFTDSWAATMTVNGVPSTTCGGVLTNTANSVTLTGGSLGSAPVAAGATSCTITVPVTGDGDHHQHDTGGQLRRRGATRRASGTLTVSSITGSKSFTAPAVQTGSTTMTITLQQPVGGRGHDHHDHRPPDDDGGRLHRFRSARRSPAAPAARR